MNAIPEKRIAAIREKIRGESAIISDLNSRISADLKKLLKPASGFLDDAQGWLVPEVLWHPPRSTNEWAKWLRFVEGILDRAITHRKWVESQIKKYGPDARVIDG
jgi:hypothetical protein